MHRIVKNTPPNSLLQPPLLLKYLFSSFPKKTTSPILVTRGDFASSKVSRRPLLQNEVTVFTPGTLCGKAHATLVILLNLPCQMEPQKQETYVLLTHRAPNMRNHSNEISMPGGAAEPGESAESAALREVEEEIGLQRQYLELFGSLPSFFLRKMKGTVTPSVAFFTGDDQQLASNLRAQIDEVQGIFVVPLRELVASTHFTAFRIPDKFKDGMPMFYRMPVFLIDEFKVLSPSLNQRYLPKHRLIWGLTAITLHETLLAFALLPN